MKRIRNIGVFALILSIGPFYVISLGRDRQSPDPAADHVLSGILGKVAEYCERLNRIALYFTCAEEVTETVYSPFRFSFYSTGWDTRRHTDVYDYQLIRKTDTEKIEERRFPAKTKDPKSPVVDVPLTTERFSYKTIVYGPIGLLGRQAQNFNTYILEKETAKLWGRNVCVIKAVPIAPGKAGWLYGRAWIDKETGGILKIEWNESSLANFDQILKIAEELNADPMIRFESQYEFEKNGIRFPSRYDLREDYQFRNYAAGGTRGRVVNKSELNVKYRDYKFFTVETTIK